jgi:sugar phosphate isomerase/epimerase
MRRRDLLAAAAAPLAAAPISAGAQPPPRRVLWAANLRTRPLADRLEAAAASGFTHMSMFPIDFRLLLDSGMGAAAIGQQIRASGVRVHVCDPFVQWVPDFAIPSGYPPDYVAFIAHDEDFLYRMAEAVGAEAVNCVEGLGRPYEPAALSDALGEFALRARRRGLSTAFEFMPISSVPDLAAGWRIVAPLESAGVGLTFDTWHYFRSRPDPALLATIPPARILEVQLADAMLALRGASLTEDLLRFRMLPGDGELDIAGVVAILRRIGAWRSVGPEVFADAMDALAPQEAARRAARSLDRFLA